MTPQEIIDKVIVPFNQEMDKNIVAPRWPYFPYEYGAWEVWLQVELCRHLDSQGCPFDREITYPGSSKIADFCFAGMFFELKCQTNNESDSSFLRRIGSDQIKASNVHAPVIQLAYAKPGTYLQQSRHAAVQLMHYEDKRFSSFHYYIDTP